MIDIYFILTPQFLMLDFAGPAEAFMFASRAGAKIRTHFVAAKPTITGALGLTVGNLEPLPHVLPPGALVLLTGATRPMQAYRAQEAKTTIRWLERTFTEQQQLACVCSAAMLAGYAGLLDGRRCTTHHTLVNELREIAPRAEVLDDRVFVDDHGLCTSAGITAGIDLSLYLIEHQAGAGIAQFVARELVVWLRRTGNDPQISPYLAYRNHMHPVVHRVQDAISRSPERDFSLAELAHDTHTSVRNLTRLFREHTGTTIVDYQQRIRVARARELLENPRHSIEHVAELVGFGSARSLRRVFQKVEGAPPNRVRELHMHAEEGPVHRAG